MVSAGDKPVITGPQFKELVEAGTRCLEANADAINALNVFPVPDGDTGINMLLTLQAALSSPDLPPAGTGSVADVSRALARGALLGARGNSGVIFSQFMKGMSTGLAQCAECSGTDLRGALHSAAEAGYQAVGKPVEGTMLTVMRAAAESVQDLENTPTEVLRAALEGAEEALARTPEQLPVLQEAGVVDAGGQGVVAFLTGALACLEGRDPAFQIVEIEAARPMPSVSQTFLEHTEEEMYGYCTQFAIVGDGLDVNVLREQVMAMAGSTVVVGDDRTVRIHAHAEDPGPLLSLGARAGALDQIKIDNMDMQHQDFMSRHGYTRERKALAVIAVAPGRGLERVFVDFDAIPVSGGQTMNPSAQDLLDAVKRANADAAIILPNNKNIVMAARQAAELADGKVIVVPSRNVPQGIAALLKYNPGLSPEENAAAMKEALDEVQGGEVTTAIRSTTVEGVSVAEGEAMALLDDHLVATAANPREALLRLMEHVGPGEGSLVTLYFGSNVNAREAVEVAEAIKERYQGLETEVIEGGQPHYHYIVSID